MTREEMNATVIWSEGEGIGLGICRVAVGMMWALDRPGPDKPDLPSIVALKGKPEDYTDEEMERIAVFAKLATDRYDELFRWRRGANLIILGKPSTPDCPWLSKKLTWEMGRMYSQTLDEAIAFLSEVNRLNESIPCVS